MDFIVVLKSLTGPHISFAGSGSLAAMGVFEAGFKKDLEVCVCERAVALWFRFKPTFLAFPFVRSSPASVHHTAGQLEDAKKLVHDAICAGIFNDLVRCSDVFWRATWVC
jgi:hypothetical protein